MRDHKTPRLTVDGVIVEKGKILLVRRNIEPFKGYWVFPGGHVEYGERVEDALKREMKEELEIEVKNIRLLTVEGPAYYPFGGQDNYNIDICYLVVPVGEPEAVDKSDVAEIDWFDPDKLPDMAFESNVMAIKAWRGLLKSVSDR